MFSRNLMMLLAVLVPNYATAMSADEFAQKKEEVNMALLLDDKTKCPSLLVRFRDEYLMQSPHYGNLLNEHRNRTLEAIDELSDRLESSVDDNSAIKNATRTIIPVIASGTILVVSLSSGGLVAIAAVTLADSAYSWYQEQSIEMIAIKAGANMATLGLSSSITATLNATLHLVDNTLSVIETTSDMSERARLINTLRTQLATLKEELSYVPDDIHKRMFPEANEYRQQIDSLCNQY